MQINLKSGVPIWRQVADVLTDQIRTGELAVGAPVPSVREIARDWDVAMSTAISALSELRKQGLISTERGRSSYVLRRPMVMRRLGAGRYRHNDDLSPTTQEFERQNRPFELTGLVTTGAATPSVAKRLHIEPGSPVSCVNYLWTDERGPIQRSTQYEPLALTGGTPIEIPPVTGHPEVIARFASIGHRVTRVTEEMYSRMPTAAESDELVIGEAIPVLFIERTHYAGRLPVETADVTLRGDQMAIITEHHVSAKRGDGR